MKTSVISCLAKYFYKDLGKKVLLVTPNTKPQDELIKRIKSNYGIEVSTKFGVGGCQALMTQGFTNKKDVKDPVKWAQMQKEFATFDVVLCDEVEYCINPSGILIFESACNASCRYGFSGTADKARGEMINFMNGLEDPAVNGNLDLIRFFGPSLVYRKPLNKKVDMVKVKTRALDKLKLDLPEEGGNVYLNIMTAIFTDPDVCKSIVNVAKAFPLLYVPVNNLVNIISHWIDNYWVGQFRILLVCGEGYIYYDLQGNRTKHTLEEACELIRQNKVDIVPSTASGFRALDLPNLKNILVFAGKVGGQVLQQVGRVARVPQLNIVSLTPYGHRKIPVFTKGSEARDELIRESYKYCDITDVYINEEDLPNYNGGRL